MTSTQSPSPFKHPLSIVAGAGSLIFLFSNLGGICNSNVESGSNSPSNSCGKLIQEFTNYASPNSEKSSFSSHTKSNNKVEHNPTISGILREDISPDQKAGFYVKTPGGEYWLDDVVILESESTWAATDVYIGRPQDKGISFEVGLFVANRQELERILSSPELKNSMSHDEFSSLSQELIESFSVIRK